MKRENESYEQWLAKVKTLQPAMSHPEAVTESILKRVARMSEKREKRKRRLLRITVWLSSAAATLLLCLLIADAGLLPSAGTVTAEQPILREQASRPLPEHWEEMNRKEKSRYLADRYRQRATLRERRDRNSRHLPSLSSEKVVPAADCLTIIH